MQSWSELGRMLGQLMEHHGGLCLSGGADHSDLLWGEYAHRINHNVIHWSFADHRTQAPPEDLIVLRQDELELADPFCHRANATLHRSFPSRSRKITNLLRRNWYQVCVSDACYAVSTFKLPAGIVIPIGGTLDADREVDGGTAWAVQMYLDRFEGKPCACYVFDQLACYWFQWDGVWRRIYQPPMPSGIWAGVGTRHLVLQGRLAVRALLDSRLAGKV